MAAGSTSCGESGDFGICSGERSPRGSAGSVGSDWRKKQVLSKKQGLWELKASYMRIRHVCCLIAVCGGYKQGKGLVTK